MTPARAATRGRATAPGQPWTELRVTVSAGAAEAVAEILRDLRGGGLVEERSGRGRVRFLCYLPYSRLLGATVRAARARIGALRRYGLYPGRVAIAQRRLRATRWATAWRAHARAVRVGRLLIRPSWIKTAPRPGDVVVAIDPGMAFGTGMHASTRLALRGLALALSRRTRAALDVFDVGTGSGILAIAAAALGARAVWAVDSDPVATAAARANVRLNRYARRIRVADGPGFGGAPGRADVIVANIVAETIVDLLPRARSHLRSGGVVVGSGIVSGKVRGVLRAARAAGYERRAVLREGDWRAVILGAAPGSRLPRAREGNRPPR